MGTYFYPVENCAIVTLKTNKEGALHRIMERNLRLYPVYATAFAAHFWLPVFFLYFQSQLSMAQVLRLEALYYFVVVLSEVPSGYFSDAIGRRITLIIAATSIAVAHAFFFFGNAFVYFAIGQACLAIGMAFNSGTNTALHFDSLTRLGRIEEYDQREARVARLTFLGSGGAALAGGLVATISLRYAYGLSLLGALVALAAAMRLVEPHIRTGEGVMNATAFLRRIGRALGELRQPPLRWLAAYGVIMIVLNHIPYEFYQPYLDELLQEHVGTTPLVSGVVTLITMLLAAQVAGKSIALRDRWGLVPTLLFGTALQALIIAAMALFVHPVVAVLILLRSCPRAIMTAPRNAAVNPLIGEDHRATYLSLESLAGRLAFSLTLWSLATVGEAHNDVRAVLQIAGWVALVAFVGLAVTAPSKQKKL